MSDLPLSKDNLTAAWKADFAELEQKQRTHSKARAVAHMDEDMAWTWLLVVEKVSS